MTDFVGTVWENGEFGVAIAPLEQPQCPFDLNRPPMNPEEAEWNRNLIKVHGAIEVLKFKGVDPLGYSPLPKNHKPGIRGQRGISSHGKKLIRNSCYRLEQECPKSRLTFATFTLPAVSRDESLFLSEQWGEIQRRFVQKLGRALKAKGLPGEIVGAVEVQEERAFRDGILALHIHLVFVGRNHKKTWAITPSEYNQLWKSVLEGYLFNSPESYDWRAVHNVQRVKKSVESYLGKYATKGVKSVSKLIAEFGENSLPRHWYTCTNSLRDRVVARVSRLSTQQAKDIVNLCMNGASDAFVYFKPIVVKFPSGKDVTVGWFGRVKLEHIDLFRSGDG